MTACSNPWISNGIHIAMQVMFAFIFLTVFYFTYVVDVEKEEFATQIDYVVDSIVEEAHNGVDKTLKDIGGTRYTVLSGVDGLMAGLEQDAIDSTQDQNKSIKDRNADVVTKSMNLLALTCTPLFGVSVILTILGYCTGMLESVKQGLIAVAFVALTEYTFLTVVTSKYKSADPYEVKRTLGAKVVDWVAQAKASGKIKK